MKKTEYHEAVPCLANIPDNSQTRKLTDDFVLAPEVIKTELENVVQEAHHSDSKSVGNHVEE
jgi:hypothetical protein